eukprot:3029537-Pyramimonas_sp.AAC.1
MHLRPRGRRIENSPRDAIQDLLHYHQSDKWHDLQMDEYDGIRTEVKHDESNYDRTAFICTMTEPNHN